MSKKVILVAFNGEPMCFVHVLLNALDMKERGYEVKIVVEGAAVKLVNQMSEEGAAFHSIYNEVKKKNLIECVCKACARKLGALEGAETQGLNINGVMQGHPSIAEYIEKGYQIITF